MKISIIIPDDVKFSDLDMGRGPKGEVTFKWDAIKRICEASGISLTTFTESPEDNVSSLIILWYTQHIKQGGVKDPVVEGLLEEVLIEDSLGQPFSCEPGTA